MPKISVIIPAYNVEKYIEKTLKSLIDQTFKDFEAIIINDGSTDNTEKIIKEVLQNANFQWKLINQENQGVSAARNRGIIDSKGEYICFLDADDYYHPSFLEKMYNKAKENNYDVVFCNYSYVDEREKNIRKVKQSKEYFGVELTGEEALKQELIGHVHICVASYICKKKLLNERNILYTKGCTHGEDGEFWRKMFFHAKLVNSLTEILLYYVQRKNSATHTFSIEVFHYVGAMKRLFKYFEKQKADNEILFLLKSKKIPEAYILCFAVLSRGENKENKELFFKSLKNYKIREQLLAYQPESLKQKIKLKVLLYFPPLFYFIYNKRKNW
ncbi:MAG: glycosyltransferase family 2 protein [Defluviitoga tunisiensis]